MVWKFEGKPVNAQKPPQPAVINPGTKVEVGAGVGG